MHALRLICKMRKTMLLYLQLRLPKKRDWPKLLPVLMRKPLPIKLLLIKRQQKP